MISFAYRLGMTLRENSTLEEPPTLKGNLFLQIQYPEAGTLEFLPVIPPAPGMGLDQVP